MAGIENQTVPMCKEIHGTLHIRVDKQEKRADKQDVKIDKIQNRLPGYAVAIQGILIATVSVLGTLLAVAIRV